MTDIPAGDRAPDVRTPPLFVVAVFTSAALTFMVQPMVAKLVLPMLGGSPAVWNTSMAFFQTALLVGYGYAHFLQKIRSVRRQIVVHIAALALAGLVLPLRVWVIGEPSSTAPILWLLGVLTLSIGLPFAVLSATAPLVQAWYARTVKGEGAKEPYALYAASNLGSLLALLAYPVILEPLLTLQAQRWTWSIGYIGFVLILAALAMLVWRSAQAPVAAGTPQPVATAAPSWTQRLVWIGLAAIPSSLMLGVTTHLTTDVASAPFLWVLPLALYLVTFIIAFQTRPLIHPGYALLLQAAALPATAFLLPQHGNPLLLTLGLHLACFFLTALVCHQALVARRPDASHLTEFYLCLSIGGVVGGAFNAFVAPQVFDQVFEYPLILALAGLARPRGDGKLTEWELRLLITGAVAAIAAAAIAFSVGDRMTVSTLTTLKLLVIVTVVSVFLLRRLGVWFTVLLILLSMSAHIIAERSEELSTQRSFFGVLRVLASGDPLLGGEMHMLAHGTTLHGAQARDPQFRCQPMLYYARSTPIGQVFRREAERHPALRIGAVGLGTGTVATYVRPSDRLTFFEIDPLVIRMSGPGGDFTYTSECAKGPVDFVLGDARLTLQKQPDEAFDILLIDAFSSDAIPAHLLTVEAMQGYLKKLKPGGVIILHLSNRHLDLRRPALAVARKAGGFALIQEYVERTPSPLADSDETAVIVGRTRAALAPYEAEEQWVNAQDGGVRPWTDDYTNLIGALATRLQDQWSVALK